MTVTPCGAPLAFGALVDYWSRALDETASSDLEAHVFSCLACASRLETVAAMARGIAHLARSGLRVILTQPLLARLHADGVAIRRYTIEAGGTVACTVAPEDELTATTLRADLRGVDRVDVELFDGSGALLMNAQDVPFDRDHDEVLLGDSSDLLRKLPAVSLLIRLSAVGLAARRLLGEYRMNHTPWNP